MFGLALIDVVVIAAYFGIVLAIGAWASRRVHSEEGFFLAGRRFGKFVQTFASFGQGTSADNAVGVTTTTFHNGAAGIWSSLLYLFGTPLYWFTSAWLRRLRVLTLGDFFVERYGSRRMGALYSLIGAVGMMAFIALGFNAMAKTVLAITPADIPLEALVWGVCVIVMLYAAAGGLEAAFLTDTLQGIGIIALSVLLIPFAWSKINVIYGGEGMQGALSTIYARLPDSHFDIFGSPHAIDFTWYYIVALSIMALLTVVIQPNMLVTCGSARDEYAARYGFVVGSYMKRFCTVLWGVFGLAAIVLYAGHIDDSDLVWGYATRDLLGPLGLGLVGLMIACLMAALMSTADCLMLTCASLLTHNLYRPLVTGRSPRHYVWAGRIFGAAVLAGSAWIALQFDTILQILRFIWEMNVALVPAFWLGMKWRRANRWGAWFSMLFGVTAFLVLPLLLPTLLPGLRTRPELLKRTDPAPLVREYQATEADVRIRETEINAWHTANAAAESVGVRPEPLVPGQWFTRTYHLPRKSVFWTQDVQADDQGTLSGRGALSFELVLLDWAGCDLAANPYALNETLRILIRTLSPIAVMLLICVLTPPDDEALLARFYAKMRTQVAPDRDRDAAELAASMRDLHRHDHLLLFPRSRWEFYKWTREDAGGFVLSVVAVFAVLGFMQLLLTIGG